MSPGNRAILQPGDWVQNFTATSITTLQTALHQAATSGLNTAIAIASNLTLPEGTATLVMPVGANVKLTSSSGIRSLIGNGRYTGPIITNEDPNHALYLENITLTGGTNYGDGGGVYSLGDVVLGARASVTDSRAARGAGIFVGKGAAVTLPAASGNVPSGSLNGNVASKDGGGLFADEGSSVLLSGGEITGNRAGRNGGGVFSFGAVDLAGGSIHGNQASGDGGGLHVGGASEFPVGFIWSSGVDEDPFISLGYGVWQPFARGRTLVGVDPNNPDFDAPMKTGGSKSVILTVAEIPSHQHPQKGYNTVTTGSSGSQCRARSYIGDDPLDNTGSELPIGGSGAHNNMPPYITSYLYRRVQ